MQAADATGLVAIGDLQGCAASLEELLAKIDGRARLVFVGDLVNRGPDSLATLRRVRALGERCIALLGNHDLHLLAVAAGIRPAHDDDTLQGILDAPDAGELIDWVRARPLAHLQDGALFVHAGVLPQWSVSQTMALAHEVEERLRAPDYRTFLTTMYGNRPLQWSDSLTGSDRLRCILNALTRLRFVSLNGTMDLKLKGSMHSAPAGWLPWFDHPQRASRSTTIIFGHWSTLGLMLREDAIGIDTGCVWGGKLTAISWPSRAVYQVGCRPVRRPQ
ncbi:MAG TPA: symmetrical bis(5'-nucleosyl)-tetraphosphatase [Burkholderiaceae bacterium]|nr:symmetrical bis(5'-nucleosyl)-tetraphosphatase [Burkholderiaceae bacterium]